ncbi:unnamed protein product (macronuclear) [Paramecium tetraurelia]|uniref:Uncharacterized protein n=1 Tax=Paramecium tetraurelia TaxID=5888 RepID=A0E3L5_PARTE|nr:uncharacterized protein GSPATT00023055001 [Paramecium tetraurelia]CAK89882.1 unnamed protein product [Paramecium tetraurelia]|eukprot:XP_001457279.1 hypothetical protein (macronuclear) [Paramecium tetraurelia strain d4-2]
MITATRSLNVRLPQLSMKNLEKSREKSNKPTIRSINNVYDYSNSPPKTRTDNISRGSLSTPLQYCRYSCYNICRVDSSFNDQEIFSAQQRSVQRNENSKNTYSDQIEKLSQRIKNLSKTKKKMQESISTKQYKKTEPYIQKQSNKYQPKSPKLILKTEEKNDEVNFEQKQLIQEKMQEIYASVQAILKSHKGYVRQVEKKNVQIQLVQLKKEFKLVNQDYNEFYNNHTNEQFKLDFELVDRIEQLKKLFENKRPTKRNCGSLFDGMDISIVIQTEADEKPNNIDFNEISEKDFEQSQDQIGQFADQITDCSPANSTARRRTTNLNKRATKQYSIQPIQIQQETTQQTQISRRKSSVKSINTPLTPKTPDSPSSMTSRNNKFAAQQIIQEKLKLPATPPKRQDQQQFQEDQTNVLKKEIQKRQSKLISRKATLEMSQQPKQKSRLNSRNSLVEVTEHSEYEQKILPNNNTTNQSQSQINIENNPEVNQNILDQLENNKEQIANQIQTQKQSQNQIVPQKEQQKQKTKKQEIKESKIIQDLYQSAFIYDQDILNKYRKNKHKNEWSQDIQSVISNYYQFF